MKVFTYLSKRLRVSIVFVLMLAILGSYLAAIWPVMISKIYDCISSGTMSNVSDALYKLMIFGAAFLFAEACSIVCRVWIDRVVVAFEKDLRNLSVDKLMHLPTYFYDKTISGEYTAKINQSVAGASQLVKVICNHVIPSVFIGVFTIMQVILNAQALMAGVFISYIVMELAVSCWQIISQNGIRESLVLKKAELDGNVCQTIQNIEMIRVTNSEAYEANRIEPFTENIRAVETKHHMFMGGFDIAKRIIKVIYAVGIIVISLALVSNGTIAAGMVITLSLLFHQLVVPIDEIHVFMDELASSSVKAKEFIKLMEEDNDAVFNKSLISTTLPAGDISVKGLTVYTPNKEKAICTDNSFVVQAHRVTALRGPTGCGKSSILKAIMGYYPSDGEISIGSFSFKKTSKADICHGIYNMVQKPIFIAGTIEDNLLYGLEYKFCESELINALKKAGIYEELYKKQKDVLSINVSEGGNNFSGGQRQRIVLARAFLRKPKWFFVDEATANVDDETSVCVFNNLREYAKSINAGILCVTHQEKIIQECDEVIDISRNTAA